MSESFHHRIRQFLINRDVTGHIDELADLIAGCADAPFATDPRPENHELHDRFARDLESLQSGQFSARRNPVFSGSVLDDLTSARRLLAEGLSAEVLSRASNNMELNRFLARCGFLQQKPDGKYYFGRVRTSDHSPPATLFEALLNLPNGLLMPTAHAEHFMNTMAGQATRRNEDQDGPQADFSIYHEQLRLYYKDVLSAAKQRTAPLFVNLPKAEEFYLDIRELYHTAGANLDHQIYVFSTTSGLVVKEQYEGSSEHKTSQYRRDYFEFLRSSQCSIYYQLDPLSTWMKVVNGSKFSLDAHQEHLASFLQLPNLELSEISFTQPETSWRREYTVVNSRENVAFSSRSPEVKEISEGLIATEHFFAQNDQHPWHVIRTLYDAQLTERQMIKPMQEVLTPDEARMRAADTFRRWKLDMKAIA